MSIKLVRCCELAGWPNRRVDDASQNSSVAGCLAVGQDSGIDQHEVTWRSSRAPVRNFSPTSSLYDLDLRPPVSKLTKTTCFGSRLGLTRTLVVALSLLQFLSRRVDWPTRRRDLQSRMNKVHPEAALATFSRSRAVILPSEPCHPRFTMSDQGRGREVSDRAVRMSMLR